MKKDQFSSIHTYSFRLCWPTRTSYKKCIILARFVSSLQIFLRKTSSSNVNFMIQCTHPLQDISGLQFPIFSSSSPSFSCSASMAKKPFLPSQAQRSCSKNKGYIWEFGKPPRGICGIYWNLKGVYVCAHAKYVCRNFLITMPIFFEGVFAGNCHACFLVFVVKTNATALLFLKSKTKIYAYFVRIYWCLILVSCFHLYEEHDAWLSKSNRTWYVWKLWYNLRTLDMKIWLFVFDSKDKPSIRSSVILDICFKQVVLMLEIMVYIVHIFVRSFSKFAI